MRKTNFFYVALAAMTLATSCSQDELQSSQAAQSEINFNASMGLKSRATETKVGDLTKFNVTAYKSESANYMTNVTYTKGDGDVWKSPNGEKYFWPVSGALNFYAYAPTTGVGTVTIDKSTQTFADFTPGTTSGATNQDANATNDLSDADAQVDLIYAVTPNQSKPTDNNTNVTLNFKHALSEISVKAMNSNTAYTVKVTGLQIGNVVSKGTYTLPTDATTSGTDTKGEWAISSENDDKTSYTTNFTKDGSTVTLGSDAKNVDASKPFMLIPQKCTKGTESNTSKYSAGHYIALKATITMKGGEVLVDNDWVYIGIDTKWEQGKHYTYTLDFTNGAGQDKDGNQIISGKEITATCSVSEFTTGDESPKMSGVEAN